MAEVAGRIAEARRELMRGAARRWQERRPEREAGLVRIAAQGPGAADRPEQRASWARREAMKRVMGLPRFAERVIGTADFVPFAPSAQAANVAMPVARLCTTPDAHHAPEGVATGLLLPDGLLLTNFHVFPGRGYARGFAANFGHARDERAVLEGTFFELDPDTLFLEDSTFDFVIVAVKPTGLNGETLSDNGSIALIESQGKVLTGMPVNIVQHPAGGPRQFAVSNNRLVDILPTGYLHYETDTDRGSSGSPVFNQDWELIALHHCGVPEMRGSDIIRRDGGVWQDGHDSEADIHWVANEGTRISFIVDRLKTMNPESPVERRRLEVLVAATADPLRTPAASANVLPAHGEGSAMAAPNISFSGPVTIHVYAPSLPAPPSVVMAAATQAPTASAPAAPTGAEKALLFDPDYAARKGYERDFLGVEVPPPTVDPSRQDELYTTRDYQQYFDEFRDVPPVDLSRLAPEAGLELRYYHFSLVFNKRFRMCMWAASNCDYRLDKRRDGRSRKEFGSEGWRFDPRVPREYQLSDSDIYRPARRIDRGHIVRREDNCWGAPGLDTEHANADSYHWTNCTPQHEAFNQENPTDASGLDIYAGSGVRGLWGHFESAVAGSIEAGGGQAVLFAGPVLQDFFEPQDWGRGQVRIPKRFWKVVVVPASMKKKPRLLAYGYVFSQASVVTRFGVTYEAEELPEFTRQRKTLAEITTLTGVRFAPIVVAAEQP